MQSVLRISEAASIALHSMIYISLQGDKTSSSKEIAKSFGVSEHHLSKVLKKLVNSELLISIKGPHGGFILGKNSDDITFLEIYEAIDGPIKQGCCLFGRQACDCEECIMGDFLKNTNKSVKEYFENKKLSDFCNRKNKHGNNP